MIFEELELNPRVQEGSGGLVEAAGGAVTNSVSKKTTHLVVGANPGSKLTIARAFGLVIPDEAALLQHLESAPT